VKSRTDIAYISLAIGGFLIALGDDIDDE